MKDVHDIVREYQKRPGESFALATLVRSHGSSYRRPGARMLIDVNARTVGSLSGGCLEGEVAERGQEVLRSGAASLMTFDTRRRFGCHGQIEILVERLREEFVRDLSEHLEARRRCVAATVFEGRECIGTHLLSLGEAARTDAFVQEIHPRPRLIVFGDGPDSVPLRLFSSILGWEVIETQDASQLPTKADHWTAAIIKSHNYGRDFAALQKLLPLPLRYLGLIGPRRRRDQLLGDLLDSGTIANAELYAPAGLDFAADSPEEIALAIVAEIQAAFSGSSCESLREMKVPIHSEPKANRIAFVSR